MLETIIEKDEVQLLLRRTTLVDHTSTSASSGSSPIGLELVDDSGLELSCRDLHVEEEIKFTV